MKPPPQSAEGDLSWLLEADLSDYRQCYTAKRILAADPYRGQEPWRSITAKNCQTQAILIFLQNKSRGEMLRQNARETKRLETQIEIGHAKLQALKSALKEQINQGATPGDYGECVAMWAMGDEPGMLKAVAKIEGDRAQWRAKCEREAKTAQSTRRKMDAETLRNRSSGFTVPVNWFEPMPVYHHRADNLPVQWGYCQATGQDRWKVKAFLHERKEVPIEKVKRPGAGRPLELYGFQTNLLVLDKWLGDWLLDSPDDGWKFQVADEPDKIFLVSRAERVCEAIYRTACSAAHENHTDEQAEQFRAVLRKHWVKWWDELEEKDVREGFKRAGIVTAIAPGAKAWGVFRAMRQAQWADITAKVAARKLPGPKPYPEVWDAYERMRALLE